MVNLVEKQKTTGSYEDGNGISLTLAMTAIVIPFNSQTPQDDNRVMVGALLKA
eukprot:CAMPEP_0174908658 /NCGR_PEP_ID=MMETSP0167-20121228/65363_1 /TAXON_ID=38298 /ORGANISM="Rhodella maculata, Strain CCMP736" /LENGTH=52 /DNA_ID=CAMNT_0016152463 /DNA_START=207 /DNA_END=362 /DNA_ORIENTATION=+